MFDHKIVITGPVGVGKTTAIESYSSKPVVRTDVKPSDDVVDFKSSTTVAMDYTSVELDNETKIHLYGTPGQERFDFMWGILGMGCMGLIILVDYDEQGISNQLDKYVNAFKELVVKVPTVIGVNRIPEDIPEDSITKPYYDYLKENHLAHVNVMPIDARDGSNVEKMVVSLLLADVLI